MSKPYVYVWLGSTGSGRREILRDIVESGIETEDRPFVLLPEGANAFEAPEAGTALSGEWKWASDKRIAADVPEGATHVFFVADGGGNPVDQIEAFAEWLADGAGELGKVITVVDSRLCHKNPTLFAWYAACIHFSDMVLMNRREDVPQKWISEFIEHFEKEHFPCLFELVKKNRVRNPALLLHPEPRRISTLFDETSWDIELEEDEEEEGEADADPYLARLPSGRRVKEIPEIARFL